MHPPNAQPRRSSKSRGKADPNNSPTASAAAAAAAAAQPPPGPRSRKRRGKARPESHAREATLKSLDHLGLSAAPVQQQHTSKRSSKSKKRSHQRHQHHANDTRDSSPQVDPYITNNPWEQPYSTPFQRFPRPPFPHYNPNNRTQPGPPPPPPPSSYRNAYQPPGSNPNYYHSQTFQHPYGQPPIPWDRASAQHSSHSHHPPQSYSQPYSNNHSNSKRRTDEDLDAGGASSGDEYTGNLLETYIGQVGACVALGRRPHHVLNVNAWDSFTSEERDSLLAHLPPSLSENQRDELARQLLSGSRIYFGSPRDRIFEDVAAGLTHPRVRRWRLRVSLIERRHHLMSMREFHNRSIRRLLARKACVTGDSPASPLAGVAAVGGNLTKTGGALQALPNRIQATAEAAVQSGVNQEWDESRWRRVLDFRNQETLRYKMPERAFQYHNPWGDSIVGPLKRGPALDGGRPREHVLLRNERPSHVTILCIVRDAASRMYGGRGTRADICDLLRDSQYIREGATDQQLNTVVSGALDRLHYEESAPVKYDAETKEWVYLHNHLNEEDFERPAWARETAQRQLAASDRANASKPGKKKRRKTES